MDRLTIAPKFLEALQSSTDAVETKLSVETAKASSEDNEKVDLTEGEFKFLMACNPMANEKLAEGIRKFAADIVKLEAILKKKLN